MTSIALRVRILAVLSALALVACGGGGGAAGGSTDAQLVAQAKAALAIGYQGSDSATSVTGDVALPTAGLHGTSIAWVSDHAAISDAGVVTRPAHGAGNASVSLTATITRGAASDTRVFALTVVEAPPSDVQAVALAKAALAIGYQGSDSATSVTLDVTLPATGLHGTSIEWATDHPAISESGAVSRPAFGAGNASVNLTATIRRGDASDTRVFALTVVETPLTDVEAVALAKAALTIGYQEGDSATSVTQNVTLPTSGLHGTTIAWASSGAAVSDAGVVTRPAFEAGNASVNLTATITRGATASDTKVFPLTVIETPPTDVEAVDRATAALAIGYQVGDSAASVTQNVTLSTTGLYGTSIAWGTSAAGVVTAAGEVHRPAFEAGNASVNLTATITRGATASGTKVFTLTVIETPPTDAVAVDRARAALEIGYQGSDSATSVTQNVTLPAAGLHGTSIAWATDDPGVVTNGGEVHRPAFEAGNASVNLTATITRGATASDTKVFALTVIESPPDDAVAVALAKAALAIGYQGSDSAASVTLGVTLPTTGLHGTSVGWASDAAGIVTTAGAVARPSTARGDRVVNLTATISKGLASDTQPFALTVRCRTDVTWEFLDGGDAGGLNYAPDRNAFYPALGTLGADLYAAWTEESAAGPQLRVRRYDGSDWSWADGGTTTGINFDTAQPAFQPALLAFGGALHAIWSEGGAIRVKRHNIDDTWTPINGGAVNGLNVQSGTTAQDPTLAACNDLMFAAWVETDGGARQLHVKQYVDEAWSLADGEGTTSLNYSSDYSATGPKLYCLAGVLYLTWTETTATVPQVLVRRYDGSSSWSFVEEAEATGINYSTSTPALQPGLAAIDGTLHAYWLEGSRVRVKRYSGGLWSSADGGAGFKQDASYAMWEDVPPVAVPTVSGRNLLFTWGEYYDPDSIPRQTRAATYDGAAMTFVDGNDSAAGLNYDPERPAYAQRVAALGDALWVAWLEVDANGLWQLRVSRGVNAGP